MERKPILTIAIPTYNMERWLEKNLRTYQDSSLYNRLEVLCLNNASEDGSKEIARRYAEQCPQIFTLIDRNSRGYGGSVNEAMERANGAYFRIVDADDWVDTGELIKQVNALENCGADVVLTDYEIVHMKTGAMTPVRARDNGVEYDEEQYEFSGPLRTLPSIHGTTYRTDLLRTGGFQMQDNIFFVDEEYVILPYLYARSVIYFPFDIYRYQVANPEQSTSPRNRAKYWRHRDKILRRLICEYQNILLSDRENPALDYCFERIKRGVGDHFTTLYMYMEDRKEGRRLAVEWQNYIKQYAPEFWRCVRVKSSILALLNQAEVSLDCYRRIKRRIFCER